MHPEFPIECTVCGGGVLNLAKHREWHSGQRADEINPTGETSPADHELTYGDVIAGWLDELDPTAVEQLVLRDATLSTNAVAGTIGVLQRLARGET